MNFLKDHWTEIATYLGMYSLVASLLNKAIPLPASGLKRLLHQVLIDWPAMLPNVNMKGIFGLPVNVPYLSLSTAPDAPKPTPPNLNLVPILLLASLASLTACAGAIKDLKVAEDVAAQTVITGYRSLNAYDQQKLEELGARAHAGDVEGATAELAKYAGGRNLAFKALDDASAVLDAADKLLQAAEQGLAAPKDLYALIPKLAAAGLAVKDAFGALGVKL